MKRDIRTTLAIDGEREFKKALNDAGREMRVLASESKAVTASFGENSGSMEALSSKNKVLKKQIEQQEEIFKALSNAVEESSRKYGESSKQTDGYKIKLNNASVALDKMKSELKRNETALEQMATAEKTAGKQADKMGKELKEAGTDTKGLKSQIKEFATSSIGQFTTIAGAVTAAIEVFKKLWETISEAAKWGKEVANVSETTGMAIDAYQEWDYILKDLDYSMEQASGDLAALGEKAMDAAAGAGEGAELFGKLGVEVTDTSGVLKSQQQIFEETIIALQEMSDETERNAIASALLSTTGEKLAPILEMTADEVEALKQEANDMGVVIKSGAVVQLELLQKELDDAAATAEADGKKFAAALAPITRGVAGLWSDIREEISLYQNVIRVISSAPNITKEMAEELFDTSMLIDAATEVWGVSIEEVAGKAEILSQVLINDGVSAAEAEVQALYLLTQGTDAQTYATEKMSEAQAAADARIEESFNTYQTISAEYLAAVEATTESILGSMGGLFSSFDAGLATSQQALDARSAELLANLESQVEGLEGWSESIKELAKRGIDDGLLQTLKDMGPDAYDEIEALNNMTDEQLEEYQILFEERGTLAKDAAVAALEPMAEEVAAALQDVKDTIAAEGEAFEELGKQLGYGIGDGIDSSTRYIKSKARKAIAAAIAAAESAADINSPSEEMRKRVGLNLGYGAGGGFVDGMLNMVPDIKQSLFDVMDAIGSSINTAGSYLSSMTSNRQMTTQGPLVKNEFYGYSKRDGARTAREFNRELGYLY